MGVCLLVLRACFGLVVIMGVVVSFLGFECLFGGCLVDVVELCCLYTMVCLSACFDRFCSFMFSCIGFGVASIFLRGV